MEDNYHQQNKPKKLDKSVLIILVILFICFLFILLHNYPTKRKSINKEEKISDDQFIQLMDDRLNRDKLYKEKNKDKEISEANELNKSSREHLAELNDLIKKRPNDAELFLDRGVSYIPENYYQAITDFSHAIQLKPNYIQAFLWRANSYKKTDNYELALIDLNHAVKLEPKNPSNYQIRGDLFLELKEYDRAIENFDFIINLEPNKIFGYEAKAYALNRKGDYINSLKEGNKAVELFPDQGDAYFLRGKAFYYLKYYDKAIEDFTKAIQLFSYSPDTYQFRSLAYFYNGDYDRAINDMKMMIQLDPQNSRAWYGVGGIYTLKGNKKDALKYLTRAVNMNAKLKEEVQRDENYRSLWNDPEFKRIVQ
ncbi:MAG: tetratricopeptide repeat protein [bacterium]|nr:tetratricopeptide repeat protein [bacterium]